jgi:hypothetical protein
MSAVLKKVSAEVDKVTKALEKATKKGKKAKEGDQDMDAKALTFLILNLKTALEQLVVFVGKEENLCPKLKEQEVRTRQSEDQINDMQQRSLIGLFIITSKANDTLETLITPEKDLKEPLVNHVQTLALTKLNMTLPTEDIMSCKYLQDGSIMLSLSNLRPESAFQKMVTEIKNPSADRQKTNMYFNFMLTRWRNSLLYEVRKLKRDGAVFKYWTDFDGTIILKKDKGSLKSKLTSITNKNDYNIRTYSTREVKEEFAKKVFKIFLQNIKLKKYRPL